MARKNSKARKIIITIIVVIVAIYLLPRIADFLLMFEDVAVLSSPVIDITEEYYNQNPTKYRVKEQTYEWSTHKRWKATWKIPDKMLSEAKQKLVNLENAVQYRTEYKEHKKYYKTLINYSASPEVFWSAVYKLIRNDNEKKVQVISDIIKYAVNKNNLNTNQTIYMVLNFIQKIEYYIPKENYFQIYPPLNSIIANKGDCDTKSLMIAMIFEDLGYDAVLFYSSKYLHAMAGVNINARGTYKTYAGKRFYFMETTAEGWTLGRLPHDMNNLRYWYTIDL